jgi:hypothetical protein
MTKLKPFAVAVVAAMTIAVSGLVAAPSASASASAMRRYTCSQALLLSKAYIATGDIVYAHGDYVTASFYYGKAAGLVQAPC